MTSVDPPSASSAPDSPIKFDDVAEKVGLDFAYYDGAAGQFFIMETTGGGMAVFDADNDGRFDLYLVNGADLPVDESNRAHLSRLFRNSSDAVFDDVTEPSGTGVVLYGQGACAGDYNNDGFSDLLVTGFGGGALLKNNGDGTFSNTTGESGLTVERWGTSAAFADLDKDGDLDCYVCTYASVDLSKPIWCGDGSTRTHCHPQRYTAQRDYLFQNDGGGCFDDVTVRAGTDDEFGRGLGIAIADYVGDEYPDVFVANDTSQSYLWMRTGPWKYSDVALESGVAFSGNGQMMAGMGVASADYDHNHHLDLFVTNYYDEDNVLFRNMGEVGFSEDSGAAGLALPSRDRLGWAAMFFDADLDGLDDLYNANGHVSELSDTPYKMRQQIFRQSAPNRFDDVSATAGLFFQRLYSGRGAATGDFDNNGLVDVAASGILEQAALLMNRTPTTAHWIGLELVGRLSNRDAKNAKVVVKTGGEERHLQTVAGTGYLSSSDPRLVVGLGEKSVDEVVVRWPSGKTTRLSSPDVNRYHLLAE